MDKLAMLALVVQLLTEGVARLYPKGTVYVAAAIGVLVAVITQTGVLAAIGVAPVYPVVDWVLAGLLLAGGAGVIQALKKGLDPKYRKPAVMITPGNTSQGQQRPPK